jgi:RNA polymerase sigma-70 factor (ECF subfamily)
MPQLKLPPPFEDAMRSLERDLMRFLMRSTGDREDSLDLFQETWLRAYRAYSKLKSEDGLRPWVFSIAANLCRNRVRDRARRARVIANDGRDPGIAAELPAAAVHDSPEIAITLRRALAALPGKQGRAFLMRQFAGFEYQEIASALDCSPESARASVYQAMKKLRNSR